MSEAETIEVSEPFRRIEHLGTGGFARTWRARILDPELIEEWGLDEVAIKIPLNRQKERALRREVELAGALHLQITEIESVNIVKYLGFEVFEGRLVMVMKYVSGGNLRNLIGLGRWKPLPLDRAVKIAHGILKGLSVIHERHIVHRDIKPENILMDGDTPKIADLGIGRMLKTNDLASTTVGTLYYMSPELLYEDSGASFNTDIWSLGVTFYEMLCGQFPFGITTTMPPGKVMSLIRDDSISLLFPEDIAVPKRLQEIISKSLKKAPDKRYKAAGEMLKDLERYLRGDDSLDKEIGEIQQLLNDPTKSSVAEQKMAQLLRKYPESARAYLLFGEFYNKIGNYNKAIEMFNQGAQKEPQNPMLHWGLAIAYEKKGNIRLAIKCLEQALSLGLESSLERYAKLLLKALQAKG